jgi:hypothetical protein
MKILLALIICCLVAACQSAPNTNAPAKPSIPPDLKISLERGPGFGTYRKYTVTIYSDGQVVFGKEERGTFHNTPFSVNQEQLQQLIEAIESSNFFALNVSDTFAFDVPSAAITIVMNGQSKRIWHSGYSCNTSFSDAPQDLCDLEDLIDEVTGAEWLQGGLLPTATPVSDSSSDEIVIVGRMKSIQSVPGCGIVYWSAVAEYTDLQVISGTYPYDVVYVIHGCPEIKRNEYAQGSGNLESFTVGDYHELHLTKENAYHTMDHSNGPYPKDHLYFSRVVNLYRQ